MAKNESFNSRWMPSVKDFMLTKKKSFSRRELKDIFTKYGFSFRKNSFKSNKLFVSYRNSVYVNNETTSFLLNRQKELERFATHIRKDKNITYWADEAKRKTAGGNPFHVSDIVTQLNQTEEGDFNYREVMSRSDYVDTVVDALQDIDTLYYEENYQGGGAVFWSLKSERYREIIAGFQSEVETLFPAMVAQGCEIVAALVERAKNGATPLFDVGETEHSWLQESATYWHKYVSNKLIKEKKNVFTTKFIGDPQRDSHFITAQAHGDIKVKEYRELVVGCLLRDPLLLLAKKGKVLRLNPDMQSQAGDRKKQLSKQRTNDWKVAQGEATLSALGGEDPDFISADQALRLCQKLFGVPSSPRTVAEANSPPTLPAAELSVAQKKRVVAGQTISDSESGGGSGDDGAAESDIEDSSTEDESGAESAEEEEEEDLYFHEGKSTAASTSKHLPQPFTATASANASSDMKFLKRRRSSSDHFSDQQSGAATQSSSLKKGRAALRK